MGHDKPMTSHRSFPGGILGISKHPRPHLMEPLPMGSPIPWRKIRTNFGKGNTWRAIPVSKLGSPLFMSAMKFGHLEGENHNPILRGLTKRSQNGQLNHVSVRPGARSSKGWVGILLDLRMGKVVSGPSPGADSTRSQ